MKVLILNSFQLNILLNDHEKEGFQFLLNKGVYCSKCKGACKKGVANYTTQLDSGNDIVIRGECAICSNPVSRVIEFGEDKTFFKKAIAFRRSIGEA